MISEILRYTLQIALISFMLGSLVDVGLKLDVKDAWTALHDRKFVLLSILSAFVFGPLLAIVIARVFELPGGYALGLLLLGLAPCAPFLPLLADIAKGDPAYSAAFILIAALGTIIVMPIALPFVAPELHAEMVSIARPLLLLVLAPFGIGIAVRRVSKKWADRSDPVIRKLVSFNVLILLSVAFAQNWDRILDTIGTLAIAAQCIFYSGSPFSPTQFRTGSLMIGGASSPWGVAPETWGRHLPHCPPFQMRIPSRPRCASWPPSSLS